MKHCNVAILVLRHNFREIQEKSVAPATRYFTKQMDSYARKFLL